MISGDAITLRMTRCSFGVWDVIRVGTPMSGLRPIQPISMRRLTRIVLLSGYIALAAIVTLSLRRE